MQHPSAPPLPFFCLSAVRPQPSCRSKACPLLCRVTILGISFLPFWLEPPLHHVQGLALGLSLRLVFPAYCVFLGKLGKIFVSPLSREANDSVSST